ncbi:MAG: bifunctional oligoribonuclease/PAP phosphatase NrnA [bacterium]
MFNKKNKNYKDIYNIIKKYDKIVIGRHVSPDPDALSSQIALRDSIRMTFPNKEVYAVGAGVSKFKYLGILDKPTDFKSLAGCLLVVLDLPNFARLDLPDDLSYDAILKIDHHPAEDIVGTVDWTDDSKSSACEMLADFLIESKMKIDKNIAEILYVGMVFDSDRFLLANTSAGTFEVVTKLLKNYEINLSGLYENLYERKISDLKFYSHLISTVKITENKFGSVEISTEDIKKFGVETTTPANMVNDFYFIKELICWCFVTYDERNNVYKVNIRSRGPVINKVANQFNGGGHKFASGCRIKNEEDIQLLFEALDQACEEYNTSEEA